MRNKLLKFLCINLVTTVLVSAVPVTETVYAASGSLENILTEEQEQANVPEEEVPTEEEAPTEEETPTEEPAPSENPMATEGAVASEEVFLEELLQKVQKYYPQMHLNEDGFFEYADETGATYIYDPYDPEFCKYMLGESTFADETAENSFIMSEGDNTTVSPFTGKTYIHEKHVSGKSIRHGIDVSKYQGSINWEKAKAAGVEFAIVRVGFRGYGAAGNIVRDEYAVQNIKNAYAAGVEVGVYFFSQAITEEEAEEEALYCYNFLKDNKLQEYISLPVFIDYEYAGDPGRLGGANLTARQHQAICDEFGNVIKEYGYEPGIYANHSMLTDDMQPAESSTYSYMNYWIARYNNATNYANKYVFWQYASRGTVDGISVNTVDCNFWYEDRKEISDASISINIGDEYDYGSDISDVLTIYDNGRKYTLKEGTDYTVSVLKAVEDDVIVISVEIAGIGFYEGTVTKDVKVTRVSLLGEMVKDIPAQIYMGKEITTKTGLPLNINHVGEVLVEGIDYTLSYKNNTDAGTATVIVTGLGDYTGEIEKTFIIDKLALSENMLSEIPDMDYSGNKITTATGLAVNMVNPNTQEVLSEGKDYTLAYSSNQNTGMAKLIITGKGNYQGKLTTSFKINPVSIGNGSFDLLPNIAITIGGESDTYQATYTGKAIKPAVTVTAGNKKLKAGTDYTVTYTNNKNVSKQACVTIRGKKNYTGSINRYFTIEPKQAASINITSGMVSLESTSVRVSDNIEPLVYVVCNGSKLEENTDYTVAYTDSQNEEVETISVPGTYNIKVTGIGSYKGTVTKKFTVIDAEKLVIEKGYTNILLESGDVYTYTGKEIRPNVKVIDISLGNTELKKGTDYTVSYSDNVKAGVARYVIKGKGKYTGTYTGTFKIEPAELGELTQEQAGTPIETGDVQIKLNKYSYDYNGKAQTPKVTVTHNKKKLKANTDYTIACTAVHAPDNAAQSRNADTYWIDIVFKGNYEGTARLSYQIKQADLAKLKITVPNQQYTGKEMKPGLADMTIRLGNVKLDTDALKGVEIGNFTNHTAVSTQNGKAGFTLAVTEDNVNFIKNTTKDVAFAITQMPIANNNFVYTIGGFDVKKDDSSLVCIYNDGAAFDQTNGAAVRIEDATGTELQEGIDYILQYSNNKNVGTAKVKVTGIGGYKGAKTIKFKIAGKPFEDGFANENYKLVVGDSKADSYVYSGKKISPAVSVYEGNNLLKKGRDYTVKYENNTDAGEATVVVSGKGNYSGKIQQIYTINPKKESDAKTIKVSNIAAQNYTGKVIIPSVKITVDGKNLKKGKDYTVSVINSTRLIYKDSEGSKGIATVIITGTGNYKGVLAKKNFMVIQK